MIPANEFVHFMDMHPACQINCECSVEGSQVSPRARHPACSPLESASFLEDPPTEGWAEPSAFFFPAASPRLRQGFLLRQGYGGQDGGQAGLSPQNAPFRID